MATTSALCGNTALFLRNVSRTHRLTRWRTTLFPTLRETVTPMREGLPSPRSKTRRTKHSPCSLRPLDCTSKKSRRRSRRSAGGRASDVSSGATLTSCRSKPSDACGPCVDGSRAPSGRRRSPYARGNHGCALDGFGSADTCASRQQSSYRGKQGPGRNHPPLVLSSALVMVVRAGADAGEKGWRGRWKRRTTALRANVGSCSWWLKTAARTPATCACAARRTPAAAPHPQSRRGRRS